MKHTYLYPITDQELWLWRASRMDGSDLFGSPPADAPDVEWSLDHGIGESLFAARNELHKRLKSRDRICIGRHYVIPGSLCEAAQDRQRLADITVCRVTELLWDAPYFIPRFREEVYVLLEPVAGRDGRDSLVEIRDFLKYCGSPSENQIRVVPVWM